VKQHRINCLFPRGRTGSQLTGTSCERCAGVLCTAQVKTMRGTKTTRNRRTRRRGWYRWKKPALSLPRCWSFADLQRRCRSQVLSLAAKELEFAVYCMSVSQAGYGTRSKSAVKSIRCLAREGAWTSGQDTGAAHEDEWDVIAILRRAGLDVKGKAKT
jgi:hypothetical protein